MTPFDAIERRMSVRSFTSQPVSRDSIQTILEAGWHAPCSCNLQLMRYVVVDDPELQARLAKVASKKVLWAPVNIFFFIDPRFNTARHASIMGLGAAMQNMALAAHAQGLASCPMAGFEGDDDIKDMLGVPSLYEAVLILGIGHPADGATEKKRTRLPLSSIVDYNGFDAAKPALNASANLDDWTLSELIDYRSRIAPVYRYQDRFALQSYSRGIYTQIAKQLVTDIKHADCVLDLMTYDGYFLNLLKARDFAARLIATDYIQHTLTSLQALHEDIETCLISREHKLSEVPDRSVDLVTSVHKVPFMPNLAEILKEAHRVLKPGGMAYVTVPDRVDVPEEANVYDGNPYYKIGPYRAVSPDELRDYMTAAGFNAVTVSSASYHNELPAPHHYHVLKASR